MTAFKTDASLKKFLADTSVSTVSTKTVITLPETTKVPEILNKLIVEKLSAIPLVDENNVVTGIVSVLDVTHFFLEVSEVAPSKKSTQKIKLLKGKYNKTTGSEIANRSHRSPLVTLPEDSTLFDAVKSLALAAGAHRVVIVNEKKNVVAIVSQGDIMKVVLQEVSNLDVAKEHIRDHKFGICEVRRVLETDIAYVAFERLVKHNISGLAVVSKDGHTLVGNISASDIKNVGEGSATTAAKRTLLPVANFLIDHSQQTSPVFVLADDTFADVIAKIQSVPVHHLFITDKIRSMNIIGVISYSNLVNMVYHLTK
eukprot:TRINITY_DN3436_c0_g1_i2.p1 TRINITY_DN3436_c0_g1~~TRINITY_DN3436_c0_g1_i2.p1  ORF type:complete len:320 (-),score=105.72 TRINITY_DN3436_c0_g1_i2:143-1081(-)